MTLAEYTRIKDLSYRELTEYFKKKYGKATKAYYHIAEDGHLIAGNISRGKEGLQCHHICEDIAASLSDKNTAKDNPIEYQQPDNLCYCNLLEHLLLHIKIAEDQKQDENNDRYLGDGGVNWIVLALNSIYSDPNNSWYSKKIANPEERGLNYNYNKIITNNKDTYLALINKYCTSAFIRNKTNKTPEELGADLCHTCKADTGNLSIYSDIMNETKKTLLFGWNVSAFADLEKYLKTERTALVQICTGGGKTTTGLEYLRIHNCKAIVLGPNNTIEDSWKNNTNVKYENYQSFMNEYKEINWKQYPVLICDEAHHIQAKRWGEGVRWALANTNVKVIGLTATPTKEQFDGSDVEFGGRICYGLDLAQGIKEKYIWPFSYIQSIYKMQDVKADFDSYGPVGTQLWDKLNLQLNQNPIERILHDNMPNGIRKIIVFVQNMKDIDYAVTVMKKYQNDLDIRIINSKLDNDHNAEAKNWFNNTNDHNVCLVTVSMVNEGAHYDGVNTLIMFRRTNSTTLYTQQLGRIVVPKTKANPKGVVFDFTNNAQNLIYRSKNFLDVDIKSEVEESGEENNGTQTEQLLEEIKRIVHEQAGKEIIYKDYTEDCVKMLNALKDAKNANSTIKKIFAACASTFTETEKLEDLFDLESWKDFKTINKGSYDLVRKPKHAVTALSAQEFERKAQNGEVKTKETFLASDAEKITTAFKLVLRRAFNFGVIDFNDNAKCEMIINDEDNFNQIATDIGFKNCEKLKKIISSISHDSYIYAVNLD